MMEDNIRISQVGAPLFIEENAVLFDVPTPVG